MLFGLVRSEQSLWFEHLKEEFENAVARNLLQRAEGNIWLKGVAGPGRSKVCNYEINEMSTPAQQFYECSYWISITRIIKHANQAKMPRMNGALKASV